MQATYTKLKDGRWGLRIIGQVEKSNQPVSVTVLKKDGTKKIEYVGRILWSGQGIMLASIAAAESHGIGRHGENECEICGRNMYTCGHRVGW